MNPIHYARITEQLSKAQLSKNLGIDRSYLVRAENGLYTDPSDTLIRYTSAVLGISVATVLARYKEHQKLCRDHTLQMKFYDVQPVTINSDFDFDPKQFKLESRPGQMFKHWRQQYWNTVTQFCNDMCIHPNSVAGFEDGTIQNMPQQLYAVLDEYNLLDIEYVKMLKEANSIG